MRQAIYQAIDREAIVKNIFAGTAKALHSPGPVGSYGYTDKYDRSRYNPEQAKQLLQGRRPAQPELHAAPLPRPVPL